MLNITDNLSSNQYLFQRFPVNSRDEGLSGGRSADPLRFALLTPGSKQNCVLRSDYYQEGVHGDFRRELLYLFNCFLSIRDPRVGGRVTHPLLTIITLVLCALVAGCDTWKSIELFAHTKRRWLSQYIDLTSGIPSQYTLARVFSLIGPSEFDKCLSSWIQLENMLHYKFDVGLHEDACQIYRGHAAENLGYIRRIVLKLLQDETSCAGGIEVKRIKAALSTRYLRKVVNF